jgi:peptide deformylase
MSILKVARMGHPVLRAKAKPVAPAEIPTPRFQQLIDDMIETMHVYSGIGLAAPQVHEAVRLFVAGIRPTDAEPTDLRGDDEMPLIVVINPKITPAGDEVEKGWEGCLSIPDVRGLVPRAVDIRVDALDRRGKKIRLSAQGLPARVIQHETDHLDGILFLDRMRSFETLTFMDEYRRYWTKDEADE